MTKTYKALESNKTDQGNQLDLVEKNIDDLPEGDLLIKVQYSSLNYKDAMSAKGIPGVTRNYPHTPGIDAAGVVQSSSDNKFKSELEDLHIIFKDFVKDNRPEIDTSVVATGEVWQGERALEVGLIDEIGTSDDYLVTLSKKFKLFEIEYIEKKNLSERFAFAAETFLNRTFLRIYDRLNKSRFIS